MSRARVWTCRKCGTRWPGTKRVCSTIVDGVKCGRKRPVRRTPAHQRVLAEMTYEQWVERFGDVCNICGRKPSSRRRLDRDHDHVTGAPRGLLCARCNRALPSWVTSEWLANAAIYLERHVARSR